MITRVYIDNFRCFTNFEVKPDRVNLLIGANGAGKSTFVEVLNGVAVLAKMGEAVEEAFPPDTRTRWDSRPVQRIELDIGGNGGTYKYSLSLAHNADRQTVSLLREVILFLPDRATPKYARSARARRAGKAVGEISSGGARTLFSYEDGLVNLHDSSGTPLVRFAFRGERSFLPQIEPHPENALLTWFIEFLGTVWLVKLNPMNIDSGSEDEAEGLDPDGENFASWYRHISQERPENLPKMFDRLSDTLPGFRSLRTVSTGKLGRKRELLADFKQSERGRTYEMFFDELSDGERATIVLYTLLMDAESEPRTLLLDEPENFVGLQLIQPWLVELAEATHDKGQLFLISHNPEVIDYLAADNVLLFERPGGGPSRVRANPFDRDEGLRASELVARGLLDAQ